MKKYIVVKYKYINSQCLDGSIGTTDTRYNLKLSKNKLVKWLIKNNFRFSIGIHGNKLIRNLDYIEVWSDSFLTKNHYERNKLIELFLRKYVKG